MVFRVLRRWSWRILGLERLNQRWIRSMTAPANPVERGRVYQAALTARPEASYADVAQQFGVTREEVCQYVTIVRRLPEKALVVVENEMDARRLRRLNLRRLLRVARLPDASSKATAFRNLIKSLPPARACRDEHALA